MRIFKPTFLMISLLLCSCLSACIGTVIGAVVDTTIEVVKVPFKVAGAVIDVATPDNDSEFSQSQAKQAEVKVDKSVSGDFNETPNEQSQGLK